MFNLFFHIIILWDGKVHIVTTFYGGPKQVPFKDTTNTTKSHNQEFWAFSGKQQYKTSRKELKNIGNTNIWGNRFAPTGQNE